MKEPKLKTESVASELSRRANEAALRKQQKQSEEDMSGIDNDVEQFVQLVYQAADEGLFEIDLRFDNKSEAYLKKISKEIKDKLFDVFVVINLGESKISASWRTE